MTTTIVDTPTDNIFDLQSQLARIFRAATPNRPFVVQQLTARAVDAALRTGAIEGSEMWITLGEALGRHDPTPALRDAFAHGSFVRGLLFFRAAILSPTVDRRDPDSFQLTMGVARALRSDDADSAIDAFLKSVLSDGGIDIAAMSPSYD